VEELGPAALYRRYDPADLGFETTGDLEDLTGTIGQERAVASIEFAAGIAREGYNIFALGAPGTGKHSVVRHYLERHAEKRPAPPDICYVHNFDESDKPRLLQLPAGSGVELRRDMTKLAERMRDAITSAFESEEYQTRRQVIEDEFKERPREELRDIEERAKQEGLVLLRSPVGMAFAPMREGEVMSGDDFRQLPEAEQQALQQKVEAFQEEAQKALRQMPSWDRDRHTKVDELEREVVEAAVFTLFRELKDKYEFVAEVVSYLDAVQQDVVERARELVQQGDSSQEGGGPGGGRGQDRDRALTKYHVNLIVDNRGVTGAPVVYEDHPTYDNLIGRIEHMAQFGALTTNFNHIKAGSLHRANGGYLMLDAHKLLSTPYAWDALKRALQSRRLRIESIGQALSMVSTVSLDPEPLELNVQIVLLGEPMLYYLLAQHDPDFGELFKVASDFDSQMDASPENREGYIRLLAELARTDELKPFDRTAVARILEQSARIAGDQEKLTARIGMVHDLLREADYFAASNGEDRVSAEHVEQAIEAQIHRSDRIRERVHEQIVHGTIMVDVDGAKVGQVNGLSVLTMGNLAFGQPSRLTARVRLGQGNVVDIEREVELGGPIHSKGVLILASYLGAHYTPDRPLSLSASLVFEQSYGGVDGDSASAAELFALHSAIAEVPLKQSLAVTGSVNQHGQVQAIGGANEKIEGFFDICRAKGMTGDQGVILPASNVRHLMLRRDVVDAVARGEFHIYPIETIDQGLELLTGMPTAGRDESGEYPEGTLNRLVEQRLTEFAEKRRSFAARGGNGAAGVTDSTSDPGSA
jgi:lon-related putative ATP-dependent protease